MSTSKTVKTGITPSASEQGGRIPSRCPNFNWLGLQVLVLCLGLQGCYDEESRQKQKELTTLAIGSLNHALSEAPGMHVIETIAREQGIPLEQTRTCAIGLLKTMVPLADPLVAITAGIQLGDEVPHGRELMQKAGLTYGPTPELVTAANEAIEEVRAGIYHCQIGG